MRSIRILAVFLLSWPALEGTLEAHEKNSNSHPNVLLLCIDDLRPELNCFGKDYIHSPNIDGLASRGRAFHRHYVQSPTCGASRYTLLTGKYGPGDNQALFSRASRMKKNSTSVPPSMPAWFRKHDYTTVSVGKVSHHPGGRRGADWNDPEQPEMPNSWDRHLMPCGPWKHPRAAMHGLAKGESRDTTRKLDVFQSVNGPDSIYPDGLTVDESLKQLDELASQVDSGKPFFLAVGIIRPHLPFGSPAKYMRHYADIPLPPIPHPKKPKGTTTWHASGEFMKYNRWNRAPNHDAEFATEVRRHYAACVSYADAQAGRLLDRLTELGLDRNTIVVLWGDHGWHLGEHGVWGKHTLFEESLRSPLIVYFEGIPHPGTSTKSMVETIDIFPTLCDLANLPIPDFVDGRSLRPILHSPQKPGHDAIAYHYGVNTIRTNTHRLIVHPKKHVELYDHTTVAGETRNIAQDHPEVVKQLSQKIQARLDKRP